MGKPKASVLPKPIPLNDHQIPGYWSAKNKASSTRKSRTLDGAEMVFTCSNRCQRWWRKARFPGVETRHIGWRVRAKKALRCCVDHIQAHAGVEPCPPLTHPLHLLVRKITSERVFQLSILASVD